MISRVWPARLALACALLVVTSGCLLPQEETVFPDLPKRQNSPLRIVAQQPASLRPIYFARVAATPQGANCSPDFSVSVEDQDLSVEDNDPSDTQQSRPVVQHLWYINRGAELNSKHTGDPVSGPGPSTRIVSAPVEVRTRLAELKNAAVVEVFVTDGLFTSTDGTAYLPPVGLPDGGVLVDTAYVDSFLWLVTLESCL
jgi:hypothetical protein